jgi:excisionase family DNA binding protein
VRSTRAGARTQTIGRVQTVDEDGVAKAGAVGFEVRRRRNRENPVNFFTIGEVAERLHVSARTVRRWIEAGDLIVHRIGGIVRIADGDLRAFLALCREG